MENAKSSLIIDLGTKIRYLHYIKNKLAKPVLYLRQLLL